MKVDKNILNSVGSKRLQSDCKILKTTITQVRIDESTRFLACRIDRFKKRKRWFVNFKLGMFKKACSQLNFEVP